MFPPGRHTCKPAASFYLNIGVRRSISGQKMKWMESGWSWEESKSKNQKERKQEEIDRIQSRGEIYMWRSWGYLFHGEQGIEAENQLWLR